MERIRQFLASQTDPAACWPWPGYRDKDGYASIKSGGKRRSAHRAVYAFVHGSVPDGCNVLHHCDNPPCCNPDHLFAGTQKQNYMDAKAKDRHSRGTRNGIAKLNDDAVRDIRASSLTQWELAHKYGVWQGAIWAVIHRRNWKHVAD